MRSTLFAIAAAAFIALWPGLASADLTGMDREFATRAMQDHIAELQKAEWANKSTASQPMKELAQKIIKNRSTANATLRTVAADQQFTLPSLPRTDQQDTQANLRDTRGAALEASYPREEIEARQQEIALYQQEIERGTNEELRRYARDFLPVLQDELKSAQTVAAGR